MKKKARLIAGEEKPEEAEQEVEEESEEEEKEGGPEEEKTEETEEPEEIDLKTITAHLVNHEERLRAIESWIFRLKNL